MTKRLLSVCILATSVLVGTQPGVARDVWRAKTSGSFVTLSYGPLDVQARPVFLMSCLNGVNIAVLSVYMDLDETEAGLPLTIQLSAGNDSTTVAGETAQEDGTGVIYGEAGDIAVTPILKVLREKGPVSMTSDAIGYELSDAGRAKAVTEFSRNCKLD